MNEMINTQKFMNDNKLNKIQNIDYNYFEYENKKI